MKITIFVGKGGVGKSTSSVAFALSQSESEKVLLIDYDGGHSLARVLAFEGREFVANVMNYTGIANLYLAVVNDLSFESIAKKKQQGENVQEYLSQFTGDYGLLPFLDMITNFFGAPTDISSTSKFLSLICLYHEAKAKGIKSIVIDVEPTAGLERLLNGTEAVTRSLRNLQGSGWLTIKTIGARWPDISAFMESEYIKKANIYTGRMTEVASVIKNAHYVIVTIPESSPVAQMGDVKRLVMSFGGTVFGYVINNIRNESHEQEQIAKVLSRSEKMPVVQVRHNCKLCDSKPSQRRKVLKEVGRLISPVC
jgi:anion-transporting  ArsA/GET3 family ATPase